MLLCAMAFLQPFNPRLNILIFSTIFFFGVQFRFLFSCWLVVGKKTGINFNKFTKLWECGEREREREKQLPKLVAGELNQHRTPLEQALGWQTTKHCQHLVSMDSFNEVMIIVNHYRHFSESKREKKMKPATTAPNVIHPSANRTLSTVVNWNVKHRPWQIYMFQCARKTKF